MEQSSSWICERCGYRTVFPDHPARAGALRVCDEAQRLALAQAYPRLHGWYCEAQRDRLLTALVHGNVSGFMGGVVMMDRFDLFTYTRPVLPQLGIYELCLLDALRSEDLNFHSYNYSELQWWVDMGDPARLRAAGDPFPQQETYRLYRGVAGHRHARRIRGLFWTGCLNIARRFPYRSATLSDPAVYVANVPDCYIMSYTNARGEDEYLVRLPARFPVERLPLAVSTRP